MVGLGASETGLLVERQNLVCLEDLEPVEGRLVLVEASRPLVVVGKMVAGMDRRQVASLLRSVVHLGIVAGHMDLARMLAVVHMVEHRMERLVEDMDQLVEQSLAAGMVADIQLDLLVRTARLGMASKTLVVEHRKLAELEGMGSCWPTLVSKKSQVVMKITYKWWALSNSWAQCCWHTRTWSVSTAASSARSCKLSLSGLVLCQTLLQLGWRLKLWLLGWVLTSASVWSVVA